MLFSESVPPEPTYDKFSFMKNSIIMHIELHEI